MRFGRLVGRRPSLYEQIRAHLADEGVRVWQLDGSCV